MRQNTPTKRFCCIPKSLIMIDLSTERMSGLGDFLVNGMKVNRLHGLNDLCLKHVNNKSNILELGCNIGVSTRLFLHHASHVTGVDMNYPNEISAITKQFNNFKFIHSSFDSFFSNNDEFYDLIYIDGDHTYNSVLLDISNALNCINTGGVIAGHDYYTDLGTGVPRAVKEKLSQFGDPEIYSDSSWSLVIK